MKALILLLFLLPMLFGCSKVEQISTPEGDRHNIRLRLLPKEGMTEESYINLCMHGIYLLREESFLASLEKKLKEMGVERVQQALDDIEIVVFPMDGVIELRLKVMHSKTVLEDAARLFMDEIMKMGIDGQMNALEAKRIKIETMQEELEGLHLRDQRHHDLTIEIEATKKLLENIGGARLVSPTWRID
jgi:hypothetical protein